MRMSRTALLPVVLLAVCLLPLATISSWLLLVLVVPVILAAWVVRVGVDLGDQGVTVRRLLGERTVPWERLTGIRVADDGGLWLVTTTGTQLRMPVLRPRDLPRISALTNGRIPAP
jgi:Bacterial PH domain